MKRILAIMLMLSLIAFFPAGVADAAGTAARQAPVSVFPNSLLYIEDEAFEGTAFQAVFLPDGFLGIGDRAFRDAPSLYMVFIPQTTTSIGTDSFPQNRFFVLHGVKGSYASDWAKQQHLPFIPDYWVAWLLLYRLIQTVLSADATNTIQITALEAGARSKGHSGHADRSMRPQDRPELNPIDYKFP